MYQSCQSLSKHDISVFEKLKLSKFQFLSINKKSPPPLRQITVHYNKIPTQISQRVTGERKLGEQGQSIAMKTSAGVELAAG